MFRPKVLTNQVKVTLFLGMSLILLPLFMHGMNGAIAESPDGAPAISRPAEERAPAEDREDESDSSGNFDPDLGLEPRLTLVS